MDITNKIAELEQLKIDINSSNPNEPLFVKEPVDLFWQMTRCEKYAFLGLLEHIQPTVSLEIGTYMGGSLQMISRYSEKVYCLDIDNQHVENLQDKFNNVHFRIGDSKTTLPQLIQEINYKKEPINFVLIDGDHSEEGVKADINAVLQLVPQEPVYIIFHDSFNPTCRKGILGASWENCPYIHYVELDYIPGVYQHVVHDKSSPRTMWGGLALAVMLPEKRTNKLKISQSQEGLFDTTFKASIHSVVSKKKLLFLSNSAFRTGAPILLLHFLRWLKANTHFQFDILLKEGGPLAKEFAELGNVYNWKQLQQTNYNPIKALKNQVEKYKFRQALNDYLLIYANTVSCFDILQQLPNHQAKVIAHIHELEIAIKQFCGEDNFKKSIPLIDKYIVVSRAVQKNLIHNYGLSPQDLHLVYEFISEQQIEEQTKGVGLELKQHLGLPADAFIVGGCGTTDWRKGVDLFIQTALLLKGKPIYFIWLGGTENSLEFQKYSHDIKKLNLENKIFLLGSRTNPFPYFSNFDIFYLSSREDPFPLVCLENAALGKPILCFADAGGIPEFVKYGGGTILPYLDLNAAAASILKYFNDKELRKGHGLASKAALQHFQEEQSIKKIIQLIEEEIS